MHLSAGGDHICCYFVYNSSDVTLVTFKFLYKSTSRMSSEYTGTNVLRESVKISMVTEYISETVLIRK